MRRFQSFRTGISKSSGQDRQAALNGFVGQIVSGLNGKLISGGVEGDGTPVQGNAAEKMTRVTFTQPDIPFIAIHALGFTVYNWTVIDCIPGAQISRSRRRPTNAGIWLQATLGNVGPDGKFDPPIVATIKMWGPRGQEPPRRGR